MVIKEYFESCSFVGGMWVRCTTYVVVDAAEGAQRGAGADDGLLLEGLEGGLAEAAAHPQRVEHALADALHLRSTAPQVSRIHAETQTQTQAGRWWWCEEGGGTRVTRRYKRLDRGV